MPKSGNFSPAFLGSLTPAATPEEFPTAEVKTVIEQTAPELPSNAFDRFDFSREAIDD